MTTASPRIRRIAGGVTAAREFAACGTAAGIKSTGGLDLGVVVSSRPCSAAGTFTRNAVRASCVDWCSTVLPSRSIRAIVCNSGNANACTGGRGERDTRAVARAAARVLGAAPGDICVAATGIIGHYLPVDRIIKILPAAIRAAEPAGGNGFARAILTTDTRDKESAVRVSRPRGSFVIGGAGKGAGMIHPDMATMLAFITSDVAVAPSSLRTILKRVVAATFNTLTIDGDTSTNDMVLMLANGASGLSIATAGERRRFEEGLYAVCDDLCRRIAGDGEGASKRVEVSVNGARTLRDARRAARAIADSNLVKTAMFGCDPNWGRIVCAVGYSGALFSPRKIRLSICGIPVFAAMQPRPFPAAVMERALRAKEVSIAVNLGAGRCGAVAHTCDLTYEYIRINAEYHT